MNRETLGAKRFCKIFRQPNQLENTDRAGRGASGEPHLFLWRETPDQIM